MYLLYRCWPHYWEISATDREVEGMEHSVVEEPEPVAEPELEPELDSKS